ncbi:MAG: precorrin-4 C(11)-methyltransferase [Rikenellaceae bacterium]
MGRSAIILSSQVAYNTALLLASELSQGEDESVIISTHTLDGVERVDSLAQWCEQNFKLYPSLIFIGAAGIAVRLIAPYIEDKYSDPAVVVLDVASKFAVALLSGHIGGGNELATRVAHIVGATPVVTTRSDVEGRVALDTLPAKFNWGCDASPKEMNRAIATHLNSEPVALLLESRDKGCDYLEKECSKQMDIYYNFEDIKLSKYQLLITVSPKIYTSQECEVLRFYPKSLHLGVGCRKECRADGVAAFIEEYLRREALSPEAVASINTVELKRNEPLIKELSNHFKGSLINIFSAEELSQIEVPNPSQRVKEVTGAESIAEASAICAAQGGELLLQKVKGVLSEGNNFTFAVAQDIASLRRGHIEFVGAGPGDPDLISVRGRAMLERADLILYAGSLVPVALTTCAKSGATVRSSAAMNLEEQVSLMSEFYRRGAFIVRLHTGDPCIYGAIQEQMSLLDSAGMSYHITPGISSFQAAAAALQSQFTIPEKVQSIILTRGEGRTPVPEKERLSLLARSQSTMCIFLSASVVESVQSDLLEHYPPSTPVAACYKLTWPEERIYRGELKDLTSIVKDNNLTLTTMIVVGEAIDNRKGLSRLYADEFKHIFRR